MSHTDSGHHKEIVFLYGPPGSGKTSTGKLLAQKLALPFIDLDSRIEELSGKSIPQIFVEQSESGFRVQESTFLRDLSVSDRGVIALGGGTLLDPKNRKFAEDVGEVVCLNATNQALLDRLQADLNERPLLSGDSPLKLRALLDQRASHYNSFPVGIDVSNKSIEEVVGDIQVLMGMFRLSGMNDPYDVRVGRGLYQDLGGLLQARGLQGPIAVVSDEVVGEIYGEKILASLVEHGYVAHLLKIPAGEKSKSLSFVRRLWNFFLENHLDRDSTIIALGGGVIGDITGFAASTYLRGIKWVFLPTSLLAMCDASLGGKTGINLPHGKNQIGAFYPPSLVLADAATLATLPNLEVRNGMAEVVKHGIIANPELYQTCGYGLENINGNWDRVIRQAMEVKIRIIEEDPFEKGRRAVLNLGHTLGHAIETVSHYRINHGFAVSIGMVAAAKLSEMMGLAETEISHSIQTTLQTLGLPRKIPSHLDKERILEAMYYDKKRSLGKLRWVLPIRIGKVIWGVEVDGFKSLMRDI